MLKPQINRMEGESRLRKIIIDMIPEHTCYVEPFFGAGGVYFGKNKSKVEVINDVDKELINLFKMLKEHTEEGKTIELKVTNKKIRGSVELLKVDSETNRPLQGAEFELWNGEKLVGVYTTDENGKIVVENLEAGNYYWNEIKAPEHYKINQDSSLDFIIYEDNQKVEIIIENEVKTGGIDFSLRKVCMCIHFS